MRTRWVLTGCQLGDGTRSCSVHWLFIINLEGCWLLTSSLLFLCSAALKHLIQAGRWGMSSLFFRQVFSRTSILFVCSYSPDETTSCSDVSNPALFSCMTGSVSYKILFYINLMFSLEEADRRLATVLQIKTVWPPALHRGDKEEAELDGWMHKAPTRVLKSLYILWSSYTIPSVSNNV